MRQRMQFLDYYKAFNKGLKCLDKQYEVGKEYEEQGGKICGAGMMHFCEEPFDCLDFYPLIDGNGDFSEFAEVEALAEVVKEKNKCASKKIKVTAMLSFKEFIKAGIDVLIEKTKANVITNDNGKRKAQIGSSWNRAKIGSSGCGAKIGSSGDSAQIKSTGRNSVVMCAGNESIASAELGSWITLAEWKKINNDWVAVCVKTGKVDGIELKPNVAYRLENGEFVEVGE